MTLDQHMSESQGYDAVTLDREGVAVRKRYEQEDFPVPAIAFQFRSGRDVEVRVTLRDDVPPDIEVEDLGFHPEYGSEFWEVTADDITFERTFDPNEEYTTVYGIRATGTDDIDQFLTTPTLAVEPQMAADAEASNGVDAPITEPPADGDDPIAGEPEAADEEDLDTLDLSDPNDEIPTTATRAVEDGETAQERAAGSGVETAEDSIVEAMAAELRQNAVAKEDVTLLCKAFDLAAEDRGSVRAKVDKLQQDVSEVVAYTDALESFLDENGTAAEIGAFEERFEAVQSEAQEAMRTVEDHGADLEDLRATVESVETTVAELEDTVEDLQGTIGEIEADVAAVREQARGEEIEAEIAALEGDVEELKQWREQLSSVIGGD